MLYALAIIVVAIIVVLVLISIVAWICYVPLVTEVFVKTPFLMADSGRPLTGGEGCQFTTSDGLVLRGTYLKTAADERLGVIAFCHELTGDRWGAAPYIEKLRSDGFDVFTFDFRNHGASDSTPGYEPMPWITWYELADVQAAIDYLCDREDADPRGIGLIGVSKGATAALCGAAVDSRVAAVVTDGAFPIDGMQYHYMRRYATLTKISWIVERLPDIFLVSFSKWCKLLVGRRRHCRFLNVEQMAAHVHQPVFMILGKNDNYVPAEVTHKLRLAIDGRTKFWHVPGAKHNSSVHTAGEKYAFRVSRFFRRYVGGIHRTPATVSSTLHEDSVATDKVEAPAE